MHLKFWTFWTTFSWSKWQKSNCKNGTLSRPSSVNKLSLTIRHEWNSPKECEPLISTNDKSDFCVFTKIVATSTSVGELTQKSKNIFCIAVDNNNGWSFDESDALSNVEGKLLFINYFLVIFLNFRSNFKISSEFLVTF